MGGALHGHGWLVRQWLGERCTVRKKKWRDVACIWRDTTPDECESGFNQKRACVCSNGKCERLCAEGGGGGGGGGGDYDAPAASLGGFGGALGQTEREDTAGARRGGRLAG